MSKQTQWITVCNQQDLVADTGIAVWTEDGPVALFYLPDTEQQIFALSHYDPLGGANVLARGIVGDIAGEPVVASPLYKQHFSLLDGRCLEEDGVTVASYPVRLKDGLVELNLSQSQSQSQQTAVA
ncbi:MAG: nitrite reductase (NAD(P)H) small subunit [Halomonadaceae bacterium]|nr:MAG: nitrite reductase (NAD(P)H) small subunit [Halomonadaceae bacterium]